MRVPLVRPSRSRQGLRFLHLLVRCPGLAVSDVLLDGGVEEEGFLGHEAGVQAVLAHVQGADVAIVNGDGPVLEQAKMLEARFATDHPVAERFMREVIDTLVKLGF